MEQGFISRKDDVISIIYFIIRVNNKNDFSQYKKDIIKTKNSLKYNFIKKEYGILKNIIEDVKRLECYSNLVFIEFINLKNKNYR